MTSERRAEIARWRDFQLWITWRDEAAKARLAPAIYGFAVALLEAGRIPPPTDGEVTGCDIDGDPLDPRHSWFGHGPQSVVDQAFQARFEAATRNSNDNGGGQ